MNETPRVCKYIRYCTAYEEKGLFCGANYNSNRESCCSAWRDLEKKGLESKFWRNGKQRESLVLKFIKQVLGENTTK